MRVKVIASGSKGNSTYIETNNTKILIDLGVAYQYLLSELEKDAINPKDIDAILITHTHSDHTKGLASFSRKHHIPIYITREMIKYLKDKIEINDLKLITEDFSINDLLIELIHTSHDTDSSLGFILTSEEKTLVYVTDTGYINQKYLSRMINKDMYILESNHDEKMLMEGPYPYILKQRVISDRGHLSNSTTAKYLSNIVGDKTKTIVLAHISENNNTEDLAYNTVKNELENKGLDKELLIAKQYESLEIIEV